MTNESRQHGLLAPPDPAALAARSALASQLRGLSELVARLERLRAHLPAATSGGGLWRGPAQTAYRGGVAQVGRGLDEAIAAARDAQRSTGRALATISARIG